MAGGKRQERQRRELAESDQPEVERLSAHGVHLPADRDRVHLHAELGRKHRGQEQPVVPVTEDGAESGHTGEPTHRPGPGGL